MYANVIVDISHEKIDRPFQYKIPPELLGVLEVGMKVQVPFGRGNKVIEGYLMELTDICEYDSEKLKEVIGIAEGVFPIESRWIKLASFLKHNYGSTMIAAMKTVLPVKKKVKALEKKTVILNIPREEAKALSRQFEEKHQTAKARLLNALLETDVVPYSWVTTKLGVSAPTIKGLAEKKIILVETENIYRNPVKMESVLHEEKSLTPWQSEVVAEMIKDYQAGERKTYLLHGITGSGKTEIYIEMIAYILDLGKEAIVLIPEIALTYQTLTRFYQRFGEQVSVVNSKLSSGEKHDQFQRAQKGEVKIMIGPRSALFTPFSNLGLIIIDEEHESSYKSDMMPKFHAREVAEWLAEETDSPLVLGSATPSLESYYKAGRGEYKLFPLTRRYGESTLPEVTIIDLREELKRGNRSMFSESLYQEIELCLRNGQQVMLFLNRRVYAGFISCRMCGHVLKCPHCDISLTDHKNGKLICHYCGYETEHVKKCPECGSKYILGFRAGTQQIEEYVKKEFPMARVLRMDGDTTKKKDGYETILSAFANEEADILIGTQMIVKGHDFPKVTLMGILAADLSLSSNDFRAAERTFQLLTQAAGRAGRSHLPGKVMIQTYQPDHYSIVCAARHDYESFYQEEISYRDLMGYPPTSNMLAILLQSKRQDEVEAVSGQIAEEIKKLNISKKIFLIGPAPATVGKISDMYRYMIYIKHKNYNVLTEIKDDVERFMDEHEERTKQILVSFDFNPINGY